jgi:type IV pilus assembly protein PilM
MFFGAGKKASIFGLDIGSSAVKIAELEKRRGGYHMTCFGAAGLQEDTIVDGEVLNHVAVVDSIKNLTDELNVSSKNIATGVSGASLIVKHIFLPKVTPKELDDQVFWEAEQYIPFDMAEISLDYEVVNESGEDDKTEILLVAAKKDFIEKRLTAIRDAGFEPDVLDIDAFALANIFWENYEVLDNTSVLLVDIGASLVKINIVTDKTTLFTRDIGIGGKDLTQEIQNKLNVSFQEAEALKIDAAASDRIPEDVMAAIGVISENMALELRRSLDFFIASNNKYPIAKAYVCGGSSKIPGLLQVIEEMIGVPVEFLNPFLKITYNPKIYNEEFIAAISASAAIPLGLALRNFD